MRQTQIDDPFAHDAGNCEESRLPGINRTPIFVTTFLAMESGAVRSLADREKPLVFLAAQRLDPIGEIASEVTLR